MRLFLSDSFFDKFTELPRNIQQKVRDFQKKFRLNPQSASIHLEPIHANDASLCSARIDRAYRAILGALGSDNFMLLYVDKHDNAYRWARNKKMAWNAHTQSCQIIPIVEDMAASAVKPMEAASVPAAQTVGMLDYLTDDALLKIGVPDELIPLVRGIKDLNDFDAAEGMMPHDAYENLFAVIDGENIDDIIADIEAGKVKDGEDTLLSNNNKRRFIEITNDEYLAKIMDEGMEKWQLFLHPSQSKLVYSSYKGTVKVSGSAGTGKTVAALHRLKHLCKTPNAKVLFTTYTKALLDNLKELVGKLDLPKQRYDLGNIDQILLNVARDNHVLAEGMSVLDYSGDDRSLALWREVVGDAVSEFDEEFLYTEYIDVIVYNNNHELRDYLLQSRTGRTKSLSRRQRAEIWKLKEKYEELKQKRHVVDRLELFNMTANYLLQHNIHPYTNVIADEFQDFSNPELRFLRALVPEGENDLFLTGDPYQRIYSNRRINFSAAGINVRGRRSQKLKVNYRTTEEIKKTAVSVVKGQKYDDLDGGEENNRGYVSLVHGEKPSYRLFGNDGDETAYIITQLNECVDGGVQLKDICIAARSRALFGRIQDRLHKEGTDYKVIKNGNKVGHVDGVTLCTFHSLKGLEYKIVFLAGVSERSMPSREKMEYPFTIKDAAERKEYLLSIRSLLYVAITRARQMVFISGYGEPTGLLEVNK